MRATINSQQPAANNDSGPLESEDSFVNSSTNIPAFEERDPSDNGPDEPDDFSDWGSWGNPEDSGVQLYRFDQGYPRVPQKDEGHLFVSRQADDLDRTILKYFLGHPTRSISTLSIYEWNSRIMLDDSRFIDPKLVRDRCWALQSEFYCVLEQVNQNDIFRLDNRVLDPDTPRGQIEFYSRLFEYCGLGNLYESTRKNFNFPNS